MEEPDEAALDRAYQAYLGQLAEATEGFTNIGFLGLSWDMLLPAGVVSVDHFAGFEEELLRRIQENYPEAEGSIKMGPIDGLPGISWVNVMLLYYREEDVEAGRVGFRGDEGSDAETDESTQSTAILPSNPRMN